MATLRVSRSRIASLKLLACAGMCAAASMGLTGCISQGEYDRVWEANNACQSQLAERDRQIQELQVSLDQLRSGYGKGEGALAALQNENSALRQQLASAQGDLRNFEGKLGNLTFGPLDAETSNRLEELARANPNLFSFDSARGMLRVSSDLTFASGSAQVNDTARSALSQLASVLNSGAATQYEVVVEGHTDSQRMANPATIREHRTNRGLSTNRANAVIDVLAGMGVPQDRLMAAGWGEFRPSVPNTSSGNTPANRRVEIYLAKLGDAAGGSTAPAAPANSQANVPTYDGTK